MWLAIAVLLSSAPSPALHHAAERAREAVITACHISGDRLAIEQDEGSSLYSVALKGSEPLSDTQIRWFARTIGSAGDAVALSIENESLGARYDRLGQRDTLANARAVLRRHGALGRLPRFDRHHGTLAAFAIRLERLCGAQARSVLRVKHGRIALRRDAPRMTGRRAAREFCAVNAAIASGHNPLYVPVIPMLHIDPPPLPIPEAAASEKRPRKRDRPLRVAAVRRHIGSCGRASTMIRRFNGLLLTAALLVPALTAADLPLPKAEAIKKYRIEATGSADVRGDPIDAWEAALAGALATMPPDRAADTLAPRFALSPPQMRELVRLWLYARADPYSLTTTKAQTAELRTRLLALLAASRRAPLVLEAATSLLSGDTDCDAADFDPLMAGSTDRAGDAWRIAHAGRDCAAFAARFAAIAPDRAMPALIAVAVNDDWVGPEARLSLLAYLTSPAGLARIDAGHRDAVRLYFTHAHIVALLQAGLGERAIATFEAVPATERPALLARSTVGVRAEADGLPIMLGDYTVHIAHDAVMLRTGLAAAYALAGRNADAEALFAANRAAAPAQDCSTFDSDGHPAACDPPKRGHEEGAADVALLDHFLHHSADDPYPIAATYYAGDLAAPSDGVLAELACRVFAEPAYHTLCTQGRDRTRQALEEGYSIARERGDAEKILAVAHIPGQADARHDLAAAFAPVIARGAPGKRTSWRDSPAIDPTPPPFAEHPIPAEQRGTAPAMKWSKAFAPLPDGYEPVRIARDGQRVAVISLSQNYDPTGEISQGGYWVHLSDDGGKSWRRPLYTGLAQHFPYDVVPDAKLPLFAGGTLNIAVAVREIDTSSISYPPVGLRLRRRADNLYLAVPIADLTRDSDGDGLTDLAAAHLLLAPDPAGTAFVVGRDDKGCTPADADTRDARTKVLQQIFGQPTGALIEPTERKRGELFAGVLAGLRDPTSADRPILVAGAPQDFACLHPDRLMIVYNEAQLARLRRMTPDFHAVELPPVIFNRARTHGYFKWSSGWTGGTIGLTRDASGGWTLQTLSSWIT